MIAYMTRIGIAISVLLNVLLGGASNQTFSARNYDRKRRNRLNLVFIIDKIFIHEPDHCMHSWSYWIIRKDLK